MQRWWWKIGRRGEVGDDRETEKREEIRGRERKIWLALKSADQTKKVGVKKK